MKHNFQENLSTIPWVEGNEWERQDGKINRQLCLPTFLVSVNTETLDVQLNNSQESKHDHYVETPLILATLTFANKSFMTWGKT